MLFTATCVDRPHRLGARKENRPALLAYLGGLDARVKTGGALLAQECRTPVGLIIIFEGESKGDILDILARDPKTWQPAVGQTFA